MNKSITMKTALAALACTACVSASAQKQYPEQEKMKPGMSEYWTPQPKVVTPVTSRQTAPRRMPSSCLTEKTFPLGKTLRAAPPNGL